MDKSCSNSEERAKKHASHNNRVSANRFGKGASNHRAKTKGDDIESKRQQGNGSAYAKLLLQKADR
jgi:hypothetical protein